MLHGDYIDKIRKLPKENEYLIRLIVIEYQYEYGHITEEKALDKAVDLVSDFINEHNDIEVIIIKRINVNDIFSNGYSELLQKLGVKEYIEYYSRGGKQKEKIKRLLSQYMEIEERPDIKRYAIQITDIYDEPVADYDGRGKSRNGFYQLRASPILAEFLSKQKICDLYTSTQISKECGFINNKYVTYSKDIDTAVERLTELNPYFTKFMISNCFGYIKSELNNRIHSILNCLQYEYRAIEYEEVFDIVDFDNSNHISKPEQRTKIRQAENKILKQMGFKKMFDIYRKKCVKKFYRNVVEYINKTYLWNIKQYYQKIMIRILDYDFLNDLIVDIDTANQYKIVDIDTANQYKIVDIDTANQYKKEIRERFKQRIYNKAKNDYTRNQFKFETDKRKLLEENQDIKVLYELNVYKDEDLDGLFFRYYENYLDLQHKLIDLLLP